MKNDLREPSWFDATLNKSFMGHSISTKLSGQFLPWLKNNFMKFGGCDIPNFTAMPIFQQICLGMQEAHTVFYQCSASTASRLSRIFSGWFTFKKNQFPTHFNTKIFSSSTIKFEFWGKKTWGPWGIWIKNDLKEQTLNWFKLKTIFYGLVNFIQTFRTAQNVIEKQS